MIVKRHDSSGVLWCEESLRISLTAMRAPNTGNAYS